MELKDLHKKIQETSNYNPIDRESIQESYKDGVEIIAKPIDMVNPYEYQRGMEVELNMANNAVGDWMEEELNTGNVKKASKKVLKNLTKDPQYYQKMVGYQMEGDSMYDIEVNKKSIEDLKKTTGKIIKENKSPNFLNEDTYTMYADKYDVDGSGDVTEDSTNKIAELSEKEGHHPFIHIDYKKVTIILFTHKINGLHENDFILASKCDIVLKSLKK